MKLHCPDCDSLIPAGDINVQALIAKCSRCGAVFSFADAAPDVRSTGQPDPPNAPLPLRAKIDRIYEETRDQGLPVWRAEPSYMRLLWRFDIDVPPPLIWPPALYGFVTGLLMWAMITTLDHSVGTPPTHGWILPVGSGAVGLYWAVRQRFHLAAHTFSPWR